MRPLFRVPPRGKKARSADTFMLYLMPLVTPRGESPQLTHRWNNIRVPRRETDHLDRSLMVICGGDTRAVRRYGLFDIRFHLGGWSRYVVVEPVEYRGAWYVGWVHEKGAGASQVPIRGRVRMLLGPHTTEFFGVTTDNLQIKLREVGRGKIGDNGPFCTVPLH